MTDHDSGYKQLFSHPELVRDLLLGFVPGPWAEQADFSTLERVNASVLSQKFADEVKMSKSSSGKAQTAAIAVAIARSCNAAWRRFSTSL